MYFLICWPLTTVFTSQHGNAWQMVEEVLTAEVILIDSSLSKKKLSSIDSRSSSMSWQKKGVQLAFVLLSMESSSGSCNEMNLGIYPFPGFLTGCAELTFNDQKNTCPTFPCFFGNKTIKQHLLWFGRHLNLMLTFYTTIKAESRLAPDRPQNTPTH